MKRGQFRTRITVQESTLAADASGQLVASWSTYCERWAKVIAAAGQEQFQRPQLRAEVAWRMEVKSDDTTRAIRPEMRIVWGDRTAHVAQAVDPDGRRQVVVIEATNLENPAA